ncbi:hypothetical protein [Coxiella-like endosymbiont of Rhipicephalus sanguineus]|nr:hypothetical protein [Coxiella-like endosymbiont of Rhipicephalus sanguineus]
MIKAAVAQGCLDETASMVESLVAIKLGWSRFYYYLFRKRAC